MGEESNGIAGSMGSVAFGTSIPSLSAANVQKLNAPGTEESAVDRSTPVVGSENPNTTEGRSYREDDNQDYSVLLKLPDWGYDDFLYERTSFQKGFDSPTGEPGWFYFRVFFNFDTQNGLFGGLLPEENDRGEESNKKHKAGDSAYNYLKMNVNHYTSSHMDDRAKALEYFGKTLSFINSRAPWFFDSISGLDKTATIDFTDPMKDRVIELGLKEDAVDMRLTSLFDLYKYACFDYMNLKEVVPQNRRQFEMVVVLFHTPLRWYHTAMKTMRRGAFPYKKINAGDWDNRMTYKIFSFKGCEFIHESIGSVYPGEMSNDEAFSLGKSKIQISYKRVYQHMFSEWARFMIGDDGVYWEGKDKQPQRLLAIIDAKKNPYYYNPGSDIFKPLVDATESRITWALRQVKPEILFGNLYLDYTDPYGDYAKMKLRDLKNGTENGQAADHKRNALNNEGIFRNIQSRAQDTSNTLHRVFSGNFF